MEKKNENNLENVSSDVSNGTTSKLISKKQILSTENNDSAGMYYLVFIVFF